MKKIILTGFALLAFVSSMYAQNTITQVGQNQTALPVQTGTNQKATILQIGKTPTGNVGNRGIVNQEDDGQTATIEQNGGTAGDSRSNRAVISQRTGPGNTGVIRQNNGSGGGALVVGATTTEAEVRSVNGNWAGIKQVGTQQTATIDQNNVSTGNFSEVWQNGSKTNVQIQQSNQSQRNFAEVFQGYKLTGNESAPIAESAPVEGSQATINQANNSQGNRAVIFQNAGSDNQATINQMGGAGGSSGEATTGFASLVGAVEAGNNATVRQQGSKNNAGIYQNDKSTRNRAEISQYGSENKADNYISQSSGSDDNIAILVQGTADKADAKGNLATINQNGMARLSKSNETNVLQTGSNNLAAVSQNGAGGAASSESIPLVDAAGGSGNYVGLVQENASKATINQSVKGASAARSEGNNVKVTQQGSGGFVDIQQVAETANSRNNAILLNQVNTAGPGAGNQAYFTQLDGDNNTMAVQQEGKGSVVSIMQQWGSGNGADVHQGSGATNDFATVKQINSNKGRVTIRQNVNGVGARNFAEVDQWAIGMVSESNQAVIEQNGQENKANLVQTGTKGQAEISQTGTGNIVGGPGVGSYGTGWYDYAFQANLPDGPGNTLVVNQTAGNTPNIANISQIGNGQSIIILQNSK